MKLKLHKNRSSGEVYAVSGPRELVARAVAEHLADERLAEALLRAATETDVVALSFRSIERDRARLMSLGMVVYAHPDQGLQRAVMHARGGWRTVAGHPEVWRLDTITTKNLGDP